MRALALALAPLALAGPAAAHPHVWIDATVTFAFEREAIAAIALSWRFDETFSDFVLNEYDADQDGVLDTDETRRVEEEAFASLGEYGWLTHLRVDGAEVRLPGYRDLVVTAEGGIVTYSFVLPLPEPVDPRRHVVQLAVYDETYYIDVAFDEARPVVLAGGAPPGCTFALFEDSDHPIYYGMVAPFAAELACASS